MVLKWCSALANFFGGELCSKIPSYRITDVAERLVLVAINLLLAFAQERESMRDDHLSDSFSTIVLAHAISSDGSVEPLYQSQVCQ